MSKRLAAILSVASVSVATFPATVMAVSPARQLAVCGQGLANFFGFQPWYACLPKNDKGHYVITGLNDIFLIIFPVVESLVKASALVAVAYIFYMLILMIVARGDAGKIATAVSGIRDAVIGFIIALISIAIVNFIETGVRGG